MPDCADCDFLAKSNAGLTNHRRWRHPVEAKGANARALEVTLGELRRMGLIELVDEARVQSVRTMAAALDDNPNQAQMWRSYRESLERLAAGGDDDGKTLEDLVRELSSAPRHASEG